ncbi:IS1/IS1595 family N-terminal zinc-binding domain-containing protein [Dactylococcopsis salina]
MNCPKCNSSKFVKNGHTHYGKQRFRGAALWSTIC